MWQTCAATCDTVRPEIDCNPRSSEQTNGVAVIATAVRSPTQGSLASCREQQLREQSPRALGGAGTGLLAQRPEKQELREDLLSILLWITSTAPDELGC